MKFHRLSSVVHGLFLKRFSWLWVIIFLGVAGCTPVESEPLMVTRPTQAATPVVTETAVVNTATPTTPTVDLTPTSQAPSPTPTTTSTATSMPVISAIIPPTRLFHTPTPYPFERPAACFPPEERPKHYPEDYEQYWRACTDLLNSPDGEWVATLVGLDICGTDVGLYHRPTGQFDVYRYAGVKHYEFLPDNRLLVRWGSCSNSVIDIIEPTTGEVHRLGDSGHGITGWNESKTAFITISHGGEALSYFWVYSVETNAALLSVKDLPSSGQVLWIEDPTYILYEQRIYTPTYTLEGRDVYILSPRQIYRASLETSTAESISNDPAHSYYLLSCQENEAGECEWPPDWIRVRRVPYVEKDFHQQSGDANWTCISRGQGCSEPDELIWLNWRTGEIETESASSISPSPTPTLPGE